MARTADGGTLTRHHRAAQVKLRAIALRDYVQLWPLWRGDDASFNRLVVATLPLVRAHNQLSASVAAAYFDDFRSAEDPGGTASPIVADPVPDEQIEGSLHVTGRVMTSKALAAGLSPDAAMQQALVRTSGAVVRHVLAGGRDTLVTSAIEDAQAVGWSRVTASRPCAFCAMLASRGPVYGEESVRFKAHDHCSCMAEPAYEGSAWPGRAREFRQLWNEHGTGDEPLKNFRRAFEAA